MQLHNAEKDVWGPMRESHVPRSQIKSAALVSKAGGHRPGPVSLRNRLMVIWGLLETVSVARCFFLWHALPDTLQLILALQFVSFH